MAAEGENFSLGIESLEHNLQHTVETYGHLNGQDFKHGVWGLARGFADMGWYISKSIIFFTFAFMARSVVDLGFAYVISVLFMTIIFALCIWNMQLHTCLAQQRHSQKQIQNQVQKAESSSQHVQKLKAELMDAGILASELKVQLNSANYEIAQMQGKQRKTEKELEDARLLLRKVSSELTNARAIGHAEGSPQIFFAEQEAELQQAREDLQFFKQELVEARVTISSLEGSARDSKRRRSV
jgi:hypothetical protein